MTKRLPDEVWLPAAKRLGVGMQGRHRHRGCTSSSDRENLTYKHLADRYVAYCQACKGYGIHTKEHVAFGYVAPAVSNLLTRPTDMVQIVHLEAHERANIADFLASKNMDLLYFDAVMAFSPSRKRFIVSDWEGKLMGRDTTGRAHSKWLTYDGQHFLEPREWTQGSPALMVEDAFSMYKVRWALRGTGMDVAVYCSLGTKMHSTLFLKMLERHREVVSFYDGDQAGYNGCNANDRELRALGIARRHLGTGVRYCAPEGLDPKDMTIEAIRDHVRALYSHLFPKGN